MFRRLPFNTSVLSALIAITLLGTAMSHALAFGRVTTVELHYFGAADCAPCIVFKRTGQAKVEASASRNGFTFHYHSIASTRDLNKAGIYGPSDALLRRAARRLGRAALPVFVVVKNGNILKVQTRGWDAALARAVREAKRAGLS